MSTEPVHDASAWTPDLLERDRSWEFFLSDEQQSTLARALQQVGGTPFEQITARDFPLPGLTETLDGVLQQLRSGRGFAVLHGFPTSGFELPQLERLYWGMFTHLGRGVTQNSDAGLIHYVTDGKLKPRQGTRPVGDPGPVELHMDLSDTVALYCVCSRRPTIRPASCAAR